MSPEAAEVLAILLGLLGTAFLAVVGVLWRSGVRLNQTLQVFCLQTEHRLTSLETSQNAQVRMCALRHKSDK